MMNLRIPILKQNGPISSPFVVPKKRHNTLWQNLYGFCSRVHAISSSWEGAEIKSHMFELTLLLFFLLYFSLILDIFSFLSTFMLLYCCIGVEILNVIFPFLILALAGQWVLQSLLWLYIIEVLHYIYK
jgi:hypothetical protein